MSIKPKTIRESADEALAHSITRLLNDAETAKKAGRKLRAKVNAYPGIEPSLILQTARWVHETGAPK
jgi:hypothetical protein